MRPVHWPDRWVRSGAVGVRFALSAALAALLLCTLAPQAGAREGGTRRRPPKSGSHLRQGPLPPEKAAPLPLRLAADDSVPIGWYRLESGPVQFGQVLPGIEKDLPGSVRARVFADQGWALRMVPSSPLHVVGGESDLVPHSRISWRSDLTGDYLPFAQDQGIVVARGAATAEPGELVVIDLRMALGPTDALGHYECTFDLVLETDWGPGPGLGSRQLSKR